MYYAVILLLMLVLPVGSVTLEHLADHSSQDLFVLTGKWFVFWAGGARLGLAGLRQIFKPAYTAETIFDTQDKAARHIVQELGFGNSALAIISLGSLVFAEWRIPAAVACAVFYLLAGLKHAHHSKRTRQQNWAMASDILVGAILAICAGSLIFTPH